MPRYSLRTMILVMLLGGPVLALLVCAPVKVWDGRFLLKLNLVHQQTPDIALVEGAAVGKRSDAEWYRSHCNHRSEQPHWQTLEPDCNGLYALPVPCWGREDMLGFEHKYGHFEVMILRVTYADNTQSVVTADIPKRRDARELSLQLPSH